MNNRRLAFADKIIIYIYVSMRVSNTTLTIKDGRKNNRKKNWELRPRFFSLFSSRFFYFYYSPSTLIRPPLLNLDRSKKNEYLIGERREMQQASKFHWKEEGLIMRV